MHRKKLLKKNDVVATIDEHNEDKLESELAAYEKNTLPVYGAFLEGENVHQLDFETKAVLLIGSESHGIGANLGRFVNKKIHIPRFGNAESLNAGIATAIICDNWKRNQK